MDQRPPARHGGRLAAALLLTAMAAVQVTGASALRQSRPSAPDGVAQLLSKLEGLIAAGQPAAYLDLLSTRADRGRATAAAQSMIVQGVSRVVIRERDRAALDGTLPGEGYRLMLEIFTERGIRARIATWQLDVRLPAGGTEATDWRIGDQVLLSSLDGLLKLALNPSKQYRVHDLVVPSDDLEIKVAEGRMFVAESTDGPTALVILPSQGGRMTFRPLPETERGQVKIFCGSDTLADDFGAVFIRISPGGFETRFPPASLVVEPVDRGLFRKAEGTFRDDITKSFGIDLADLSRESWSFTPMPGDLLAELHTRHFGVLTYTKVENEAEDISLFDRTRKRNIAVYPSQARIAERGRFFNEDTQAAFAVERTDLNVTFDPDRYWIDGVARLRLRIQDEALNNLTVKLAESLNVRSIYSPEYGRLLSLRVRNQNSVIVTLPTFLMKGAELTLLVSYAGRLVPPPPDREGFGLQLPQDPFGSQDESKFPAEPSLLYSTNSAWYPQGSVTAYGQARMRMIVPERYQVLASGKLLEGFPKAAPAIDGKIAAKEFEFEALQPIRYLACVISRFVPVASTTIPTNYAGGGDVEGIALSVETNPRLQAKGRATLPVAEDLLRYYRLLVGEAPYPSLTVGLVERDTPGGHSPAYLSVLNEPTPNTPFSWGNDPAAFPTFPEFFVAHELAHQWWGQAVGWRSYHERWISEGFAQYFAALYAKQIRGEAMFNDLVRRMAKWGKDQAAEGPISLGYRLGHIRGDSRVFRALVYNKSAVVLDMLRRVVGDDVFFRGLRRFYKQWRFRKAGTDDVQQAFEAESGQKLGRFFEGWVHGAGVPVLKSSWQLDAAASKPTATVRLEQVGPLFDYPVTVTLRYANGSTTDVPVLVRDRSIDTPVPLSGTLRDIEINRDGLTILTTVK